jgi:4-hydroxybenzoyl-CoA reductase subunit beta
MTTLMTPFEFEKPTELAQVFDLIFELNKNGQKYIFSAGSTDLLPMFKKGINLPDCLISLTAINELKGITLIAAKTNLQQRKVRIGASVCLAEIVDHQLINQYFPELARAAGLVANPQIRNQATIGGNLLVDNRCIYINQSENNRSCHSHCFKAGGDTCHLVKSAKIGDKTLCQARFVSDTAPILMLLNATLLLQNKAGLRKISLKDFYCKDGIESNHLAKGELLVAVEIPIEPSKQVHYEKLAIRKTLDFASVGVALSIKSNKDSNSDKNSGNFELEIALTGIQTLPGYFIFNRANFDSDESLLAQACRQANDFSLIYQQDFFPRAYRKKMIAVFIRRCFKLLTEQQA